MRKHTWASCFRRRSERSSVRSTRCTPDSRCRLQVQVPRRATNDDKDIRHILRTQVLRFRFTIKDIDRTSVLHTGQPEPPCTHTVPMFRTGCAGSTLPELIGHPASSRRRCPALVWLFYLQPNSLPQAAYVGSSLGGIQCDMDLAWREDRNHHLLDALCRLSRSYRISVVLSQTMVLAQAFPDRTWEWTRWTTGMTTASWQCTSRRRDPRPSGRSSTASTREFSSLV